MKWLLWREYRVNLQILIAGVVLLLLPFVLTLIIHLWPKEDDPLGRSLGDKLGLAAFFSCALSQLTVVLLAGNAFAGERTDRSAEFMAYLPISRQRRLVSKLGLAAFVTLLIWGINLGVIWIFWDLLPWQMTGENRPLSIKYAAITGFGMFGVAWGISSLQSSPTFAAAGGIVTPILISIGLFIAELTYGTEWAALFAAIGYTIISATLAVIGFSTGTWYFLKRVEP